jgi:hypothetical protein
MHNGKMGPHHAILPVILLIIGILWYLAETGSIVLNIPWWPVTFIVVSLVMLAKMYMFKK